MAVHTRRSSDKVLRPVTTIHTLPVEILLNIFALVVQWNVEDWKCADDIHHRPVLLSHVCSKWRFAILEASTLWTCIAFHRNLGLRTCISRSKQQPVDIVHSSRSPTKEAFKPQFEKTLRETSDRWRTVLWESSELDILDMLTVLNSGGPMPRLSTLELGLKKRAIPSVPLHTTIGATIEPVPCAFPALQQICLSRVALTELPPSTYPSLSSLTLHWPAKYPTTRPGLFRLSSVLSFLLRSPQLASLSFVKSCPLMDVRVLRLAADAPHGRTITGLNGTQLRVSTLRHLEWSYAPPRDLWRLFLHVDFPKLRQLELYLDATDSRWYTYYDGELEPLDSIDDLPQSLQASVITFNEMEELSLCASDEDGLCTAVKRMEFPRLKKLALAFLKKRAARLSLAKPVGQRQPPVRTLPSVDAIFREPRLMALTHLTLSDFTLDRTVTMSLLAYMPSLENLTLDSCEDAGAIICALGGAACGSPVSTRRSWTCRHLQHLCIIDCGDVPFRCLRETVLVRKLYAEERVKELRGLRPSKPLRKGVTTGAVSLPTAATVSASSISNGQAQIPASHESTPCPCNPIAITQHSRPARIVSVAVRGGTITDTELSSLQGLEYGVDSVLWQP